MSGCDLIVIGGSAGAIEALGKLLAALPARLPPVALVVHVLADRPSLLAEVLATWSPVPVVEAIDKQPLEPGRILVAPPDYHLLIEDRDAVALSRDPAIHFSRPSIDALFESAATAFGADCAGVLLTGASRDGAAGLAAIRRRGGRTAAQRPDTAYAPEMPRAAIELGAAQEVRDPAGLGQWLRELVEGAP